MMVQLKLNLSLLIILIYLVSISESVEPSLPKRVDTMAFIKASCKNTLYQDLCIRYLSKFTNPTMEDPQQLAHIALSVSLSRALHTRAYLMKVTQELNIMKNTRDYSSVQDCLSQINDSVDQLEQSMREIGLLKRLSSLAIDNRFLWHISNVETWVSTALTDANTCVNSFSGHKISKLKALIRVRAQNVVEVTSNALALFHGYAAKYRAAAVVQATKKP